MPDSVLTRHRSLSQLRVAMVFVCWCAGCSTLPLERYTFDSLPNTYVAARRENPHTLELARLAGVSKRSDTIDNGDVLRVSIAAGLSQKDTTDFPVRVQESGVAILPVIGEIPLAGLSVEEAEADIELVCIQRELYRNPHVTVTIAKQRTNRLLVLGAVEKPGTYELPRGDSDLLSAISAAGGLSKDASTLIEIRNPNRKGPGIRDGGPPTIAEDGRDDVRAAGHSLASMASMNSIKVDLVSATREGGGDYHLEDGGVVQVERRDPEPIFVQGLVKKPDRYEYPPAEELRLLGAISMSGGLANPVADKVYVIRRKPESSETFVIDVKVSDAKRNEHANLLLAPGDVVSVEQTPATMFIDALRKMNLGLGATLPLTTFFGL